MKRLIQSALLVISALALLLAFIPAAARADDTYNEETSGYNFLITDYNFTANVSENDVYDITETMSVTFNQPGQHGIYRDIPYNQQFVHDNGDGTQSITAVPSSVSDISVDGYPFHTETDYSDTSDVLRVYIGDPDKTVTGDHVYKLHYKIGFGDDQNKAYDEAYFNILGTGWDNYIDHFSFSVTLPKPFDPKNLGFSMGQEGATGYDPGVLMFSVKGNTISGEITQHIPPYTGITMREVLPEGYFTVSGIPASDLILLGAVCFITIVLK